MELFVAWADKQGKDGKRESGWVPGQQTKAECKELMSCKTRVDVEGEPGKETNSERPSKGYGRTTQLREWDLRWRISRSRTWSPRSRSIATADEANSEVRRSQGGCKRKSMNERRAGAEPARAATAQQQAVQAQQTSVLRLQHRWKTACGPSEGPKPATATHRHEVEVEDRKGIDEALVVCARETREDAGEAVPAAQAPIRGTASTHGTKNSHHTT